MCKKLKKTFVQENCSIYVYRNEFIIIYYIENIYAIWHIKIRHFINFVFYQSEQNKIFKSRYFALLGPETSSRFYFTLKYIYNLSYITKYFWS